MLEIGAEPVAEKIDIAVLGDGHLQRPFRHGLIGHYPSNRPLGFKEELIETFPLGGVAPGRFKCPFRDPWMDGVSTEQKIHLKIVFVRSRYFKRKQISSGTSIFFQTSVDPAPQVDINTRLCHYNG